MVKGYLVSLDDFKSLFQTKWFYNSRSIEHIRVQGENIYLGPEPLCSQFDRQRLSCKIKIVKCVEIGLIFKDKLLIVVTDSEPLTSLELSQFRPSFFLTSMIHLF